MAGDIFFTDTRHWSSSSAGFLDIVARSVEKCRSDEDWLIQVLKKAETLRCLDVHTVGDRGREISLTTRILEAACDAMHEARTPSGVRAGEIAILEKLVATAKAHLKDLEPSC